MRIVVREAGSLFGEMAEPVGELTRLSASLTGEMRVEDVPLAPGVDLAALTAGDDDPLQVVVAIPAGRSTRKWNYLPQTMQSIAGEVASNTANGFLGHQKAEDVDYQFLPPVTHWVGAKWQDGKAYFRGVVDAAAKDLKRWIRSGRIKQVSIFGQPTLKTIAGETQVIGYKLLSIDWTPLDRSGMPTRIVAMGEMDWITGDAGNPAGEIENQDGGVVMTFAEIIAELRKLGAKPAQVLGEMGWAVKDVLGALGMSFDQVAGEMDGARFTALTGAEALVGEMAQVLGVEEGGDVLAAVRTAAENSGKFLAGEQEKVVDKVVGEMVTQEAARPMIKRMLQVDTGADEAAVKAAVGEMLEQEDVKSVLSGFGRPAGSGYIAPRQDNRAKGAGNTTKGLRPRKVSI
ncbi:MAG: transcriptional regulator [bacterium]|nr:transcriptional regulator [bacterium]